MKQLKPWLLVVGAAMVLVACGGGGGGGEASPPPTEADPLDGLTSEATQSVSGWIGYLTKLVMSTAADGREPVAIPDSAPSTLPVDNENEPTQL